MAKGFDKIFAKSAVQSHSKIALDRTHLTTMDIGQIIPFFCEETVPGDKFHVNGSYFSRMAPLKVPTYGKCNFKTASFFVPYHQIAEDADAFISGKTTWQGRTPVGRYIAPGSLFYLFQSDLSTASTSTDYDYTFFNESGAQVYRKFTSKGRYYYKILTCLGYQLPSNIDLRADSYYMAYVHTHMLSAYPLLAFAKAYNDWMSQSQRFNSSELTSFLYSIKYCNAVSGKFTIGGEVQFLGIRLILDSISLNYENDYFISAWQSANNPINSQESLDSLNQNELGSYEGGAIYSSTQENMYNASLHSSGSTYYAAKISERALQLLRSFDNWVRRHNYAGSREVQQIYAQFGIKSDQYKTHFAHLLNTSSAPMQVGDIMSMAETTNSPLGDYAGKGIVNGNSSFDVNCDDYGMILTLGWLTVIPMNPFGFARHVLRKKPLDYYTPEFDGVGVYAIPVCEYFSNPKRLDQTAPFNVYGFTERYNDYRFSRDQITGDFRLFEGMDDWHFGRDLSELSKLGTLVAQSTSVVRMGSSESEYNRIFNLTDSSADHFFMTARFDVSAIRPMKSLSEVANLGDGNLEISRNGNELN